MEARNRRSTDGDRLSDLRQIGSGEAGGEAASWCRLDLSWQATSRRRGLREGSLLGVGAWVAVVEVSSCR